MKMIDSSDLESAKLVEVVTTRMVSSATMRIYLKAVGMFLVIYEISEGKWDIPILDNEGNETGKFTSHPAKELCLLIVKSLEGSTTDNNDFNFIIGNPKGDGIIADTKLLRDVTLTSHADQIQALLDIVISHCNKVTFPFKDVTQEQFDEAKTKFALSVDTPSLKVGYPQLDSSIDYTVTLANSSVQFSVMLAAPALADTRIDVFVHLDNTDQKIFDPIGFKVGSIYVKKGNTSAYPLKVSKDLSRKIQASAISNIVGDFNLIVKAY